MTLNLRLKVETTVTTREEAVQLVRAAIRELEVWTEEVLQDCPGASAGAPVPLVGKPVGQMSLSVL